MALECHSKWCNYCIEGTCTYVPNEEQRADGWVADEDCGDYEPHEDIVEDEPAVGLFDRLAVHMTHTLRSIYR